MLAVGVIIWLGSEVMFFSSMFAAFFTIRAHAADLAAPRRPPRHHPGRHLHHHPGVLQLHHAEGRVRPGAGRAQERQAVGLAHPGARHRCSWPTSSSSGSPSPRTRPPTPPTRPYGSLFYIIVGPARPPRVPGPGRHALPARTACGVRGATPGETAVFQGVSYYWHFVDVVWVGLYCLPVPAQVMAPTPRRSVAARLAAPAALVGAVAVFGLIAFSSGPAQADTTTTTTAPGRPSPDRCPAPSPAPCSRRPTAVTAVPSAAAAAKAASAVQPVRHLSTPTCRPRSSPRARRCSRPTARAATGPTPLAAGTGPNLQGLGRRHGRLLGLDRPHAARQPRAPRPPASRPASTGSRPSRSPPGSSR